MTHDSNRTPGAFSLRSYQEQAVGTALAALASGTNGIVVCPTGGGKSLVIASIAHALEGHTLILQPSKEILEQNVAKMRSYGEVDIGIWSASCGVKELGEITFATIGSIMRTVDAFRHFQRVLIDECHFCNAADGQYKDLLGALGVPAIGLSATPWRLRTYLNGNTGEPVAESRMLTRTRPRLFDKMLHITQVADLTEAGYLCPVEYFCDEGYDQADIRPNSTGADFDEGSLLVYDRKNKLVERVVDLVGSIACRHILVFTSFCEESRRLVDQLNSAGIVTAEVSGQTPKAEREAVLAGFYSGSIRVVVNVQVFGVGFDFPALDCVIMAKPTKSVGRWYQCVGRAVRSAPGKDGAFVYDLCGNLRRFGRVDTFRIVSDGGQREPLWRLRSERGWQTDVNLAASGVPIAAPQGAEPPDTVAEMVVPFGKHKDHAVKELPIIYVRWAAENLHSGKWKSRFAVEYLRRRRVGSG